MMAIYCDFYSCKNKIFQINFAVFFLGSAQLFCGNSFVVL